MGRKRGVSRELFVLSFVVLSAMICFAGRGLAGAIVTYDDESQITWSIRFRNRAGWTHTEFTGATLLSPTGNHIENTYAANNTITVKNITASPPSDFYTFLVMGGYDTGSRGGLNWYSAEHVDPVTGNTVIFDNAKLDHPDFYSSVYGGYNYRYHYHGGYRGSDISAPSPPTYGYDYTESFANTNQVILKTPVRWTKLSVGMPVLT